MNVESTYGVNYYESIKQRQMSETVTSVLYPNDITTEGKELRLKQQYFFSSATLQDILERWKVNNYSLNRTEFVENVSRKAVAPI